MGEVDSRTEKRKICYVCLLELRGKEQKYAYENTRCLAKTVRQRCKVLFSLYTNSVFERLPHNKHRTALGGGGGTDILSII